MVWHQGLPGDCFSSARAVRPAVLSQVRPSYTAGAQGGAALQFALLRRGAAPGKYQSRSADGRSHNLE